MNVKCTQNVYLYLKMKEVEKRFVDKGRTNLMFVCRKAIKSIRECETPIRSRDSALRLVGVGSYVLELIMGIIDKMSPEDSNMENSELYEMYKQGTEGKNDVHQKKLNVSRYLPRVGTGPYVAFLSIVMNSMQFGNPLNVTHIMDSIGLFRECMNEDTKLASLSQQLVSSWIKPLCAHGIASKEDPMAENSGGGSLHSEQIHNDSDDSSTTIDNSDHNDLGMREKKKKKTEKKPKKKKTMSIWLTKTGAQLGLLYLEELSKDHAFVDHALKQFTTEKLNQIVNHCPQNYDNNGRPPMIHPMSQDMIRSSSISFPADSNEKSTPIPDRGPHPHLVIPRIIFPLPVPENGSLLGVQTGVDQLVTLEKKQESDHSLLLTERFEDGLRLQQSQRSRNRMDDLDDNMSSSSDDPNSETMSNMSTSVPKHVVISGVSTDWEVVLLIDTREKRTNEDRSFIVSRFQILNISCESRVLGVGDIQWILRNKYNGLEVMLNYIIERKTVEDLVHSIMDGRYKEQQYRLLSSGIQNVFYVVEGNLHSQSVMGADKLRFSLAKSVINRRLHVFYCAGISDTILLISQLHSKIQQDVKDYFLSGRKSCLQQRNLSFQYFQNRYGKQKSCTMNKLWCAQLRQIPRCTPDKVAAIAAVYPTSASLAQAYRKQKTEEEREQLLAGIVTEPWMKKVGPQISRFAYLLFCGNYRQPTSR